MTREEIVAKLADLESRIKVIEEWKKEPITPKQIDFIASLIRELPEDQKNRAFQFLDDISRMTKGEASMLIDGLIEIRDNKGK